jgi:hypothetical protein
VAQWEESTKQLVANVENALHNVQKLDCDSVLASNELEAKINQELQTTKTEVGQEYRLIL